MTVTSQGLFALLEEYIWPEEREDYIYIYVYVYQQNMVTEGRFQTLMERIGCVLDF